MDLAERCEHGGSGFSIDAQNGDEIFDDQNSALTNLAKKPAGGALALLLTASRGPKWISHHRQQSPLASVAERDQCSRQQNGSTVMPRFYFHIDDDRPHIDRVGVELSLTSKLPVTRR
jgi:hypothetical protein